MKKTKIIYWIFTVLIAALMLFSSIGSFANPQQSIEFMHNKLGYPIYFISFISIAKILGVIGILVPGFPRLKEWAYAGLLFDLAGAAYSCIAVSGSFADGIFMIVGIAFLLVSYAYHHKLLKAKAAGMN